jgi:hypothetical protein
VSFFGERPHFLGSHAPVCPGLGEIPIVPDAPASYDYSRFRAKTGITVPVGCHDETLTQCPRLAAPPFVGVYSPRSAPPSAHDRVGIGVAWTPQRSELCRHVGGSPIRRPPRSLARAPKAMLPRGMVEAMAPKAAWLTAMRSRARYRRKLTIRSATIDAIASAACLWLICTIN